MELALFFCRMWTNQLFAFGLLPLFVACSAGPSGSTSDQTGEHLCTEQLSYGVSVKIKPPAGSDLPALEGFQITVNHDGETLSYPASTGGTSPGLQVIREDQVNDILIAADLGGSGSYDVSVLNPHYQPIQLTGLQSQGSDGCHTIGASATVTLASP